ncbi:MAG: hypothetical protein GY834_06615 [Bacteroidetes bacterium]|nr:hypothetical protein [Bacteroidota bacterium]
MIKYIQHNDIDLVKWDDCITRSFNGMVYAFSWYLDSVCKNWDALVEDDYVRVFPLPVKIKFGFDLIYQPFFTQQLGVFSQKILTEEVVINFLNTIPSNFKYLELNLNTFNKIDSDNYQITPQLNHELDLINTYENLAKKYSKNLKRNLKKANESQLSIIPNIKPDDIIELFRQNKGKGIKHLTDRDYLSLKRLVYSAIHRGVAEVLGAYTTTNELCGGVIYFLANRKLVFLFSGLNESGKQLGAMPKLIDYIIREKATQHLTFDFEGSNTSELARFYKSFGAKEVTYSRLVINRLSLPFKLALKTYRHLKLK